MSDLELLKEMEQKAKAAFETTSKDVHNLEYKHGVQNDRKRLARQAMISAISAFALIRQQRIEEESRQKQTPVRQEKKRPDRPPVSRAPSVPPKYVRQPKAVSQDSGPPNQGSGGHKP